MSTKMDKISKKKKMYYSYKEILSLTEKLSDISLSRLKDKNESPSYPTLDEVLRGNETVSNMINNINNNKKRDII